MQRSSSIMRIGWRAGFAVLLFVLGMGQPARAQATAEMGALLRQMQQLGDEALGAARAAEGAATVDEVRRHADAVVQALWGLPSGLAARPGGEAAQHGWKEQWQVDGSEFDEAYAARYGTAPPTIRDPQALGLIGRGRHVRRLLEGDFARPAAVPLDAAAVRRIVAPLNNAIGWMKMDDGVTKGERQPRVDLTRAWDAPTAFWLSTADTGWLFEAYAQALNLLKTDYAGDLQMARRHAADLTRLLQKAMRGVDHDGDGTIAPVMMEGGLQEALQQARAVGLLN